MKYRADIDGLRALAVVPVIFYHAGLPVFSGGFAGVDVFFVISGYLMASMIGDGLARGNFSFADFYERRVRRIFPALFAILLFCAVVATAIIPPKLYGDFGVTLVATVLFGSNILFWRKTANYFDAPTELNPLLHTWSLAVEEQFYIVFPVFLWLIWRSGARASPSRRWLRRSRSHSACGARRMRLRQRFICCPCGHGSCCLAPWSRYGCCACRQQRNLLRGRVISAALPASCWLYRACYGSTGRWLFRALPP